MTETADIGVNRDELLAIASERGSELCAFLDWADRREHRGDSMRLIERPDIGYAAEAAEQFAAQWWGIVVFTCFGSKIGTAAVADAFREPLPPELAEQKLTQIDLPRRSIGHHRIQPGHRGAKLALIAACDHADSFHETIFSADGFDERYRKLRALHARQWGRTTTFDLFLRVGALSVGGHRALPEIAYLAGSTGPSRGFKKIFGVTITDENVGWAETLLRAWTKNWSEIAALVGADWRGDPYTPGDFENALCIWHERKSGASG
jgi:hypothetical protein